MNESGQNRASWVVQTSEDSFQADVFKRSRETPVVVDFWAAWCQPCRLLAPLLEKLAEEMAGRFVLVKAETELTPRAAAEFGVQSIPAVYGVVDGKVVDFFQGVLPEEQLRDWIGRLLLIGTASEAQRLEASDPAAAESKYRELAEKLPNESTAAIGLARVALGQGRHDEARQLIEQLEKRGFLEPEAEKIKAALELHSFQGSDVEKIRASAEAAPDDLKLQLQLAEALAAKEQYEEALQIGLAIVQRDRQGVGERARKMMVDIFRVLSDDSPLTSEYRRKLSSALY